MLRPVAGTGGCWGRIPDMRVEPTCGGPRVALPGCAVGRGWVDHDERSQESGGGGRPRGKGPRTTGNSAENRSARRGLAGVAAALHAPGGEADRSAEREGEFFDHHTMLRRIAVLHLTATEASESQLRGSRARPTSPSTIPRTPSLRPITSRLAGRRSLASLWGDASDLRRGIRLTPAGADACFQSRLGRSQPKRRASAQSQRDGPWRRRSRARRTARPARHQQAMTCAA
jgi:hypothetical protein